jgi:hypothetical protein
MGEMTKWEHEIDFSSSGEVGISKRDTKIAERRKRRRKIRKYFTRLNNKNDDVKVIFFE